MLWSECSRKSLPKKAGEVKAVGCVRILRFFHSKKRKYQETKNKIYQNQGPMKYLKLIFCSCILLLSCIHFASAQRYSDEGRKSIFFFGIGTGIDYGGIGLKAEIVPFPYLGIFAGAGFNFQGVGVNGGLSFKALPFKKLSPTIQAMYGYNAVIVVKGATEYNKTYYGPSVGAGLDWTVGRNSNKLFFGVYYPFRSDDYEKDLEELKDNPAINFENEPLPVTISFGFNFGL